MAAVNFSGASSASVFATPELLLSVFRQCDLKTCTVAAQVSGLWHDLAMNEIWTELPDPLPLFRILAPMDIDLTDEWVTLHFY